MRTSIALLREQERAILQYKKENGGSTADTIRHFITLGIEYEKRLKFFESLNLKTLYILRRLAAERGEDFLTELDNSFEEQKEELLQRIEEGVTYVGD